VFFQYLTGRRVPDLPERTRELPPQFRIAARAHPPTIERPPTVSRGCCAKLPSGQVGQFIACCKHNRETLATTRGSIHRKAKQFSLRRLARSNAAASFGRHFSPLRH
jgi:hypothetical protein